MNARAITSSVRRRQRRAKRTPWMTEAEASVALAADPRLLPVEARIALYQRIELRAENDVFAQLVKLMVFEEPDARVRRAPLAGRRSIRHTFLFLHLLFTYQWTKPGPGEQTAIIHFLPRVSSRQVQRLSARQLALLQHCLEVTAPPWGQHVWLALIERVHHACAARLDVSHASRWTRGNLIAWLDRYPDARLPEALVTALLCAPEAEIRTFAFQVLLPRVDTGSVAP